MIMNDLLFVLISNLLILTVLGAVGGGMVCGLIILYQKRGKK